MALIKVIEVIASSPVSVADAIRQAVAEVSKTVRNVDSVEVKSIKATVANGEVATFDVIVHISFRVDSRD
ncbi:MAG TPA: dodecin family protein [Phnomibacter sp.]|jgi:dodecin|nr:dodecin family protein [Phnomibacter sp.]